ncbi:phage integrase family protein [mine drainage metagenome]|uniref:Phage integrase family protein n=1 Tax=mine drainage metagenome TaxID=410659 RepID=T0Y8V0_9ZZZZ
MEGEMEELLKVMPASLYPIVIFAIETGMRRGEIAQMKWDHVDLKKRVLLVPETKSGEPRRIPLSTEAIRILSLQIRRLDGKVWDLIDSSITSAFKSACKVAGIDDLNFHDLRHEATSRFFEKGLNPMQVATITGHKTLQMLKRYTHLKAEDLAEMLR